MLTIIKGLSWVGQYLNSVGVDVLLVEYGWGCRLDTNQLWQDLEVKSGELMQFVESSVQKGIYVPGDSDLIIRDPAQQFEFMPCHESHIHLATDDVSIIEQTKRYWIDENFDGFEVVGKDSFLPLRS